MTAQRAVRTASTLALAALLVAAAASPALAQTTGTTGGSLSTFLQNIVTLMNSGVIRLLAVCGIIMTAAVWLLGHLDLRRMATVILGIVVMFSAAAIVDTLVGSGS